jgi:hypothetical protein
MEAIAQLVEARLETKIQTVATSAIPVQTLKLWL